MQASAARQGLAAESLLVATKRLVACCLLGCARNMEWLRMGSDTCIHAAPWCMCVHRCICVVPGTQAQPVSVYAYTACVCVCVDGTHVCDAYTDTMAPQPVGRRLFMCVYRWDRASQGGSLCVCFMCVRAAAPSTRLEASPGRASDGGSCAARGRQASPSTCKAPMRPLEAGRTADPAAPGGACGL